MKNLELIAVFALLSLTLRCAGNYSGYRGLKQRNKNVTFCNFSAFWDQLHLTGIASRLAFLLLKPHLSLDFKWHKSLNLSGNLWLHILYSVGIIFIIIPSENKGKQKTWYRMLLDKRIKYLWQSNNIIECLYHLNCR